VSQPANTPPFTIGVSTADEWPYIATTWTDANHRSPLHWRQPYRDVYRPRMQQTINALADQSRALVARLPSGRAVGWIVYSPGRSISTVHYVYARHMLEDVPWRRRGLALALIDAAELGRRFVYTHKGEWRRGGKFARGARSRWPRPLDEELAEALQRRGVTAVYEPVERWLTP
jgi:hypothetical protein